MSKLPSTNPFSVLAEDFDPSPKKKEESVKPRTGFASVQNRRKGRRPVLLPTAVETQLNLRKKYRYGYREVDNGNVENNSTLYLITTVAHHHQIEELFRKTLERAKQMSKVFGKNFDCDYKINLVRSWEGKYLGYAYVDVSNPAFYYALIGLNIDGTDRAEFIDDPAWVPPPIDDHEPDLEPEPQNVSVGELNWADEADLAAEKEQRQKPPAPPKIRRELPPLITLGEYEYDEEQKEHLRTNEAYGNVSVCPAFITPGVDSRYDDCSLYISEVPDDNPEDVLDFLYAIFARYARSNSIVEDGRRFFPKINVRRSNKGATYATVTYAHPYDTKFAFAMLRKIRAKYKGEDIEMHVRSALRSHD